MPAGDLKGLRSRWQSVFQRPPPDYLPRHLLFAIITYRIQADRLGDLDHEIKQVLDRTDPKSSGVTMPVARRDGQTRVGAHRLEAGAPRVICVP